MTTSDDDARVATFRRALEHSGGTLPATDDGALASRLAALVASARQGSPGVALDDAALLSAVAERVASRPDPLAAMEELCGADLRVALGCAASDVAALARLRALVHEVVPGAVRRIDPSHAFADEIEQLVLVRLAVPDAGRPPRIGGYQGRGTLASWLRVVAARLALDHRPRAALGAPDAEAALAAAVASGADPEVECVRLMVQDEFAGAFREALSALEPRARSVLKMAYLDGASIDRIGAVYRVHRATAARWVARAEEELLDGTRARLGERMRLGASECKSLMRAVQSHLELSLGPLLREK